MATRKAIYEHAVLTVFQEDERKFLIKTETNFSCEPYPTPKGGKHTTERLLKCQQQAKHYSKGNYS